MPNTSGDSDTSSEWAFAGDAMDAFIDEARAYALLKSAGLTVPRHGLLREPSDVSGLPFRDGEGVVLKGVVRNAWHKSERGLVRFGTYDVPWIQGIAEEMQSAVEPEDWRGLLVVEKMPFHSLDGLPVEALVALRRSPEAGWVLVLGIGGLHANAWGEIVPPLLWPLGFTEPEAALEELKAHRLGRIWLGRVRQGQALTTEAKLKDFLAGLWRLAALLESQGIGLLEMNPVVLDAEGCPVALDGVGEAGNESEGGARLTRAPQELHRLLVQPRRIAVAGISSHAGSPGRVILENLLRSQPGCVELLPVKPNEKEILGLPCIPDVEALRDHPVDQLILALPASKSVRMIEQLCQQGGGAEVVYLVPGGLGDGADGMGRGARLEGLLAERRAQGLWTPLLVGPNGVGFLSSEGSLNALFIPHEKLPFEARGGPIALVSQSGAFLLACLSKAPLLPLRYGVSIGNQLDVRLSEFLGALACDPQIQVVACYVEGFRPGDLMPVAKAIGELRLHGKSVLLYKGGRSQAGQAAARSHTGALAGDWALQRNVLRRAGAILASSHAEFDAAAAWLAAYPQGRSEAVAVLTNAGYEAVASADHVGEGLSMHELTQAEQEALSACLAEHGLEDLVSPHLPLDLTPMAGERAFLDCARLLAEGGADTLVLGLVPFTQYLETVDEGMMGGFAQNLRAIADQHCKRLGVVVDSGPEFEPYRQTLMKAGLPTFPSMERALMGLRLLSK